MPNSVFQDLSERYRDQLICMLSTVGSANTVRARPLFLYHARRTSGVAFFYAMKLALDSMFRLAGIDPAPASERIETDRLSPGMFETPHAFVGSHFPFGLHEKFREDFLLTTIVREPYSRLGSTYMSGCMRSGTTPGIGEFEAFIGNPENRNGTIRQLCGLPPEAEVHPHHLETAVETLNTKFHSFVTTRHTNDLIRYYLSAFGLPNVVMDRPNKTEERYRIDISAYEDFIYEKNALDVKLVEFVTANPRLPRHEADSERISPVTIIAHEMEGFTDSQSQGVCMSTETFTALVRQHPDILDHMSRFWNGRSE